MGKYLKMADVFKKEVLVDNSTAYTIKEELDKLYRVREVNDDTLMCSSNFVAEYAAHAINSHDELVAEVERLRYENSILRTRLENSERLNGELLSEQ